MTEKNRTIASASASASASGDGTSTSNANEDSNVEEEELLTVDTPGPTAVEPPPEALAGTPLETNIVAIPIEGDVDADANHDASATANARVNPNANANANANTGTSARTTRAATSTNTRTSSPTTGIHTHIHNTTAGNELALHRSTCTVYAPATLEPGYTFTANVDGIDFVVTVPNGGVTEGEPFLVPYPQRSTAANPTAISVMEIDGGTAANTNTNNANANTNTLAPHGRWRNHMFDCFEVFFTGIFWQGCFCTIMLLGQIMTRLRLNACAVPADKHERTICILLFVWIIFLVLVLVLPNVFAYLIIPFIVYLTILVANTRYFMRQKYNIPAQDCSECDGRCNDCCCSFWCMCCIVCQMARHTHPQREYPYQCCSKTGLGEYAPAIV